MKPFGTSQAALSGCRIVLRRWRLPIAWLALVSGGCFYEVAPLAEGVESEPPISVTAAPTPKDAAPGPGAATQDSDSPTPAVLEAGTTPISVPTVVAGGPIDAGPVAPLPSRCLDDALIPKVYTSSQVGPYVVRVAHGSVYWLDKTVTSGRTGALKTRLETGGSITALVHGLDSPFTFEVDETHAYWTSPSNDRVGRVPLDQSGPAAGVALEEQAPHDLAIDDTHVYWANFDAGKIRKLAKATIGTPASAPVVLANGVPRAKMIATSEESIYFTWDTSQIGKVAKDGLTPHESLVTEEQLVALAGEVNLGNVVIYDLAVDEEFVYFRFVVFRNGAPNDLGRLMRIRTDGSSLEVVKTDNRGARHSFMQLVDGLLYLPLSNNSGGVWRFDPSVIDDEVTVLNCQFEANPTSVAVSERWIYWANSRGATINRTPNR